MLCGRCDKFCPTQAVDYFQEPEDFTMTAATAVIATGFELTPLANKVQYGEGQDSQCDHGPSDGEVAGPTRPL